MVCERQAEAIGTSADKNGLAGVESDLSPEFTARRARWATEQPLVGESAVWAFDRAIAATLRIERCERAIERVTTEFAHRAKLAWELDQAFEVAKVLAKLKHDPVLASRQIANDARGRFAADRSLAHACLGARRGQGLVGSGMLQGARPARGLYRGAIGPDLD